MTSHSHWSTATDKIFIKKIYESIGSFIDSGEVLDLGVEDYNFDCNTFISNQSIKYSDNFPKHSAKWNKGGENSMTSVTIHLKEPLLPKSKYYIKLNVVDKKYIDLAGNLLKPRTITFVTVGGSMVVRKKGSVATTWGALRGKRARGQGGN